MSKFNVGDTIFIKPWDRLSQGLTELDPTIPRNSCICGRDTETDVLFVKSMQAFCGKYFVVEDREDDYDGNTVYTITVDDEQWEIAENWIELDIPVSHIIAELAAVMQKYNAMFQLNAHSSSLHLYSPGNEPVLLHEGEEMFQLQAEDPVDKL